MGFIRSEKEEFIFYEIEEFKNTGLVDYFFTTRIGFNDEKLIENISSITETSKERIITLKQIHGNNLLSLDNEEKLNFALKNTVKADGIVTNMQDIVILTFHADCVPVAFLDKTNNVIAVSHAGWKGTLGNISGNTVDTMIRDYDSKIQDILVGIGPSIGPCCYEVGEEVYAKFYKEYDFANRVFKKRKDKLYLDLWNTNEIQLLNKGILKENIYISNLCTSCNNDIFYSYRKEKGTNKRMASVMKLKL